ncbi:hypothetical protein [Stenotrophomonas maltophilia]|nr:hypothetical protein [Stenotrophomonas maltophilia]
MDARVLLITMAAVFVTGCAQDDVAAGGAARANAGSSSAAVRNAASGQGSGQEVAPATAASARGTIPSSAGGGMSAGDSPYLAAESVLMQDGALSVEQSDAILTSDKVFEKTVRAFADDAGKRPEAQDLTAHYRQAIARSLGKDESLGEFACGYSLCIGSVRIGSAEEYEAWTEKFGLDTAAPTYSFSGLSKKLDQRNHEGRFVFSTDPAARSMIANQ